jgi:hypothetical protein
MSVQSVILDKNHFTEKEAHNWIKTHGFKTQFGEKKVHVTDNTYRYRQLEPKHDVKYRIKKVTPGVEFVMEYRGEKK